MSSHPLRKIGPEVGVSIGQTDGVRRLAGWLRLAPATDLSPEESAYIEFKLKLSDQLKKQRKRKNLMQVKVARLVRSSQSRVAKMEAGDPTVSIDLLIRSLLALGATSKELGRIIGSPEKSLVT